MIFKAGDFTSHSGLPLSWKIDLDDLTWQDWETLARMASERLPPFGRVEGVPIGGMRFAEMLRDYTHPAYELLLIADDVLTTGASMEAHKGERLAQGVVVFARGPVPFWVTPLFSLAPTLHEKAVAQAKRRLAEAGDRRDWEAANEAEEALDFLRRNLRGKKGRE